MKCKPQIPTLIIRAALLFSFPLLVEAVTTNITLDGSLGGRSGPVTLNNGNYAITADMGKQRGGNLFHSFGQFTVGTGDTAQFSGPSSVSNIIGRVTGGNLSEIDGTLSSTIPGANLFLLNPAGFLFGANASLNIPGAFHASTGDYLSLSDGARFYVSPTANSAMTIAAPSSFGFLSNANHGDISLEGAQLQSTPNYSISFSAGNINLTNLARVSAPGAAINITAVGNTSSGNDVKVNVTDGMLSAKPGGNVLIDKISVVGYNDFWNDYRGLSSSGVSDGPIRIRGGAITVQNGSAVLSKNVSDLVNGEPITIQGGIVSVKSGSEIYSTTTAIGAASNVAVVADSLTIDGIGNTSTKSWVGTELIENTGNRARISSNTPEVGRTGNSGNVSVTVFGKAELLNNGGVNASTFNEIGNAGSIDVIVDGGSLTIDGSGIASNAGESTTDSSHGGNVMVLVRRGPLTLTNQGYISSGTVSAGDAGIVKVQADGALSIDSGGSIKSFTTSTGDAGMVKIQANGPLTIDGGGSINLTIRYRNHA